MCCIPYRNQSFVLFCETSDWFLNGTQHLAEMGLNVDYCKFSVICFTKILDLREEKHAIVPQNYFYAIPLTWRLCYFSFLSNQMFLYLSVCMQLFWTLIWFNFPRQSPRSSHLKNVFEKKKYSESFPKFWEADILQYYADPWLDYFLTKVGSQVTCSIETP